MSRKHILVVELTDDERTRLPLMLGYATGAAIREKETFIDEWAELSYKITEALSRAEIDEDDADAVT